jgi:glycosyltransferase involved in cell wall biosynthesis
MRLIPEKIFKVQLRVVVQYFKNNPDLKSKLIKILQKIRLHNLGLRVYALILKLDGNMIYTFLIPDGINILDFQRKLNAASKDDHPVKTDFPKNDTTVELLEQFENQFPSAAVICSLYKVEEYLDTFLSNIRSQEYFHAVEFCFILCAGDEFEIAKLKKFTDDHSNCKLIVEQERIGIYKAWNLGVQHTSAPVITNWNADDSRRPDSLRRQIQTLNRYSFIDVVYQDLYVTLEPKLPWSILEKVGRKTKLPSVSVGGLLQGYNAPHNAPMWRRSLHDEIGYFDEKYHSSGDYEFWLRAAMANKLFLKDREPHVSYYVNPQGLSTSWRSHASVEMKSIQEKYRDLADLKSRKELLSLLISDPTPQSDEVTKKIISRITNIRMQNE